MKTKIIEIEATKAKTAEAKGKHIRARKKRKPRPRPPTSDFETDEINKAKADAANYSDNVEFVEIPDAAHIKNKPKTRQERERSNILYDVMLRKSNTVGSTYDHDNDMSWHRESIQDYINTLIRLQLVRSSQLLQAAYDDDNKDWVTKIKLKQDQRRWYVRDSATGLLQASALLLDFDVKDKNGDSSLYDDIVRLMCSLPNTPYQIISSTSSGGVHVVIPTRSFFPVHLQPILSRAYAVQLGISQAIDQQAVGGEGRGFFDPRYRTTPLQFVAVDGEILDHTTINADVPKKLVDSVSIEARRNLSAVVDTALREQRDVMIERMIAFLKQAGADKIDIKPALAKHLGVVGSYRLDGVSCKALGYANGIMVGSAWNTDTDNSMLLVHDADTRKELMCAIAQHYITCSIQHTNTRWYWVDGSWMKESTFISNAIDALNMGYGYVLKQSGAAAKSWNMRIRESKEIAAAALHSIPATYPIKSNLLPVTDHAYIWKEFGIPEKLTENVHFHRVRSVARYNIKNLQERLGYPVNGWHLSRKQWPARAKKYRTNQLTPWHIKNMPDYGIDFGYINLGWTEEIFMRYLTKLPPCVIVSIPDINDKKCKNTSSDPYRYQRELVLCRQRIHAAAVRGCHVIVLIGTDNYEARGMLHVHQAKALVRQNFDDFAITLPNPDAEASTSPNTEVNTNRKRNISCSTTQTHKTHKTKQL